MSPTANQAEVIHSLQGILTTLRAFQEAWLSKHPNERPFLVAQAACTERLAEIVESLQESAGKRL